MGEVTIEQGKLRCSVARDFNGQIYYAFQGIPYAKPPLGDLRFKAPQPPEKWSGIFDATKEGTPCMAMDIHRKLERNGGEDCLVLNVYTKDVTKKLPVMFWIHGGGFVWGSSTTYEYSPDFLITQDVVVVTINYRLGIFGFLSFEDSSLGVPGNAGFKDMIMALKWVQKNISHFGGDPGNVTIFGESAGGGAVHLLNLSPMAKGLFHKGIAQSGCALNPWIKARRVSAEIAKIANLSDTNDRTVFNYLQGLTTDQLFDVQKQIVDTLMPNHDRPFGLTIETNTNEEAFLTEEPLQIIKSGNFNHVPLIIGYTTAEALCLEFFRKIDPNSEESFQQCVPGDLGCKSAEEIKHVIDEIKKFYFGNPKAFRETYDLITDTMFLLGIYQTVKIQSKVSKAPIYFYQVSIESELNFLKKLCEKKIPGASHCDDLGYLFRNFMTPDIKPGSIEDIGMKRFIKMWTNFAKYGNPVPEKTDLLDVIWNPAKTDEVNYLDIGETLTMKVNPEPERMQFWIELYASRGKPQF